jgi:hypothetical protein
MPLTMYEASVTPMRNTLKSLSTILSKGAAHCEARKIDPNALLQSRLYPDMFPLVRQVQIATDTAKGAGARLAGIEIPSFADTETTFPELQARIDKTLAFLDSLQPSQFEGAETRQVVIPLRDRTLEFKGADYLTGWANPNFFFHVTTAYALLRHGGVEIGKRDYLGG